MCDCTITQLKSSDASTAESIRTLIEQLTGRESTFSEDDLRNVLQDSASRLFVMRHKESIVGMLSLGIYTCPTGRKVWVEDVVIDSELRGKGLGEELVEYALQGDISRCLLSTPLCATSQGGLFFMPQKTPQDK